jgi:hypothetical protein
MVFRGYTYIEEIEAIAAVDAVNTHYGFPINPEDTTQAWVAYEYSPKDRVYYILYHDSLFPILGEAKDFILNLEESYDTKEI